MQAGLHLLLLGTLEDRFSHVKAHMYTCLFLKGVQHILFLQSSFVGFVKRDLFAYLLS